jgi:hypothetical protein
MRGSILQARAVKGRRLSRAQRPMMDTPPTSMSSPLHGSAVPPPADWPRLLADPRRASQTLTAILQQAVRDLGVSRARLLLASPVPEAPLTMIATTAAHAFLAPAAADWLERQVLAAGTALVICGGNPLPTAADRAGLPAAHTVAGAPLTQAGRVIGVLTVGTEAAHVATTPLHAALVSLADAVSAALPVLPALGPPPLRAEEHALLFSLFPWPMLQVEDVYIRRVNAAAEHLLGRSAPELCRMRLDEVLASQESPTAGGEALLIAHCGDGGDKYVQRVDLPVGVPAPEGFIGVALIDQTREQELLNERLKTAELSGIFGTIATVNHQINNPLFGLMATLQLLEEELKPSTPSVQRKLTRMMECAERIKQIAEMLTRVVRPARGTYAGGEGMLDLVAATDAGEPTDSARPTP